MCPMSLLLKDHYRLRYSKYICCLSFHCIINLSQITIYSLSSRLRGKVVLKGRRPVGSADDYDTDDEADDDMTELQSIWTEKTSVTGVSTLPICIYITISSILTSHSCMFLTIIVFKKAARDE